MSGYQPFDHEKIMLGLILTYGTEAGKYVFPQLTHDKFIYSKEGQIGGSPDHMRIWQAITLCLGQKVSPSVPAVMDHLSGYKDYQYYLQSLTTSLRGYYQVSEFDPRYLQGLAQVIDRNGVIFRYAEKAKTLGKITDDPQEFMRIAGKVSDVDEWANNVINDFRTIVRPTTDGYVHASVVAEEIKEKWDRIWRGDQFIILPSGLPSLTSVGMFPVGRLAILHGRSNGGKSAFMRQVLLGTAIGLVRNEIAGCVAINSLEEDRGSVIEELASKLAGVNLFKLWFGKDGMTEREKADLTYWLDYVSSLPIYIDSTNLLTVSALEWKLDGLHTSDKGPVWQLGADYLELIKDKDLDERSKEQIVHAVASKMFTISRQTGASTILVSQSSYGKQGSSNKEMIAGGDGLRYSSGTFHVADIVCENVNYPEMTRKGVVFQPAAGMDANSAWSVFQKGRGMPIPPPVRWEWQAEYVRYLDPKLNYGRSDDRVLLFDHFLEDEGVF